MPKRTLNALFLSFATMLMVTAASAENEPPAYQHIKGVEKFAGVWESDFDPPGDMPPGKLQIEFEWMGNKSYLVCNVFFRSDSFPAGKRMNPETTIVGYSEKESETKAWIFKYGTQGRLSAGVSQDKLVVGQQEGQKNEPVYRSQMKTYELIDKNTMLITTTGEENGTEQTVDPPLTLKRKTL